ncbi:MAG: carboxymuconolactone decarboxylase family protein [Acidimicrobiia bacterium]|nr:carboxymuconolactone decarboxylase family protein [Acidimicrobiia bacterium]
MGKYREIARDLREPAKSLREAQPETFAAFGALHEATMADGEISAKTKELIALALSVVKHCDGCIVAHARGAARRGATDAEVAEALGVAVMMDGGPATVWAPRAWEAFQEFAHPEPTSG